MVMANPSDLGNCQKGKGQFWDVFSMAVLFLVVFVVLILTVVVFVVLIFVIVIFLICPSLSSVPGGLVIAIVFFSFLLASSSFCSYLNNFRNTLFDQTSILLFIS